MQLAAITDEISQDFDHALEVLLEYNALGAELRGLWDTNIADLSQEQAERARKALQQRNMKAACLSTPFFKCDITPETENKGETAGPMHLARPRGFEEQLGILRRCIELAHFFDTPFLRVFSFWKKEPLTADIERRIVEAFAEPVEIAKAAGVTLLLENEHACFLGTGEEAARVAQAIDSPALRLIWDPGNAFCAGEVPFPTGYNAVRSRLSHVHLKDARHVQTPDHGEQCEWTVIGEGEIDYPGQFAALHADGYNGWLSLETHYRPPVGSAPDGKGTSEEGSRPCLAALNQLLKPYV